MIELKDTWTIRAESYDLPDRTFEGEIIGAFGIRPRPVPPGYRAQYKPVAIDHIQTGLSTGGASNHRTEEGARAWCEFWLPKAEELNTRDTGVISAIIKADREAARKAVADADEKARGRLLLEYGGEPVKLYDVEVSVTVPVAAKSRHQAERLALEEVKDGNYDLDAWATRCGPHDNREIIASPGHDKLRDVTLGEWRHLIAERGWDEEGGEKS